MTSPTTPTTPTYVTFTITNNIQANGAVAGADDASIYIFVTQEALNQAWQIDTTTGIATPVASTGTLAPLFTLADLAAAGGAIKFDSSVQVSSARLYISNSASAVSNASGGISGPTASTATFFYDFVEFALNATTPGATASTPPNVLNVDTTQVDQLGIPLTLQVTPNDPSFGAGSGIVATLDRQTLISNFETMATGAFAPFADCIYPPGSGAGMPYRLLNPSDVIGGQLAATSLQGTIGALGGAAGAWQATFTITGPGTTPPTNGALAAGMPVSGPLIPTGATVSSLPGSPAGSTVVMTCASTATTNPFTASTSTLEVFFITPPVTKLATYFDADIDAFFTYYKNNPGTLKVEQNNDGDFTYIGNVVPLPGITDINGNSSTYTVLQFTGGAKETYNIYYPFFSTNSPAGKLSPLGEPVPPPPAWWAPAQGLMYYAPPSMMVFGASGVFADNVQQAPAAPNSTAVLGAIENVIVTALARGHATTWQFLNGTITPGATDNTTATVTLAGKDTTAKLSAGSWYMASFQISNVPMTATFATGAPAVTQFPVTSPLPILPTSPDLLTFSQFYPAGGTWSAFANFLHNPAVSIGGRAYGLPFDDQGGFSSDLNSANSVTAPASASIVLGPWLPAAAAPQARREWGR